jgi:cyclopropane fatty-acyl-phospholipid synthase-like methyltransferase
VWPDVAHLWPARFCAIKTVEGERRLSTSTKSLRHRECAGLMVLDIEVLRLHCAKTLQICADRFEANREKARAIYDERFCRIREFYRGAPYVSL